MSWVLGHLVVSELPLLAGRDYKALCGRILHGADWVDTVDWNTDTSVELKGACGQCKRNYLASTAANAKRYLYLGRDGEEAMEARA